METLLIVEDSKSFSALLKDRIESSLECRVVLARAYAEAKAIIEEGKETFFLGVLDLHLPDAPNGEIVDLVIGQKIPAIVLTGQYQGDLRDQILRKGVLDYFIKDNIRVVDAVIYFIDRLRRNRDTQVLVVDDSRSFRSMLCQFLRQYGFSVLEAGNGQAALDLLEEHEIRLVLSDYQMEGMDGFKLTKRIRAKFSRDEVGVIGLSSSSSGDLAARFIKAGANDFLVKPFRNEELFCRVSQNIEIIEKHQALEGLVQERTKRLDRTLEQLRARENYLKSVMDTALDAIVTTDEEGWVVDFNPAAEKLFGYTKKEMLGRNLIETIIPEALREKHKAGLKKRLEMEAKGERLMRRIEVPGMRADGDQIDLEMALTSVNTSDRIFFTGFMHDITQRKQLVKSLEETLTVAESANRAKSEFLANMSHEIRTPMNAIIGMTDLVIETELTEEQKDYLKIVQQSSQSLLELINSILDLSKIEAGRLRLEQIPFDLLGRMENACETLAVRAHQKALELWCRVEPDLPVALVGDPLRLGQVLINLVNNAIKFTESGEVVLRVSRGAPPQGAKEEPGAVLLQFSVADSGIGIPQDRLDKIFERFTQADGSTTRQFGGTGLGLTISRHLVRMMAGELWVESQEGVGSVFHFTAQFKIGERGAAEPGKVMEERSGHGPGVALADVRGLVVMDNQPGGRIVGEILGDFGMKPITVRDAASFGAALDQAQAAGKPFEVVVLDQAFLDPDARMAAGWERHPGWRGRAIVLIESHQRIDLLSDSKALTEAVFLRKPVKKFALLRTVNTLLGRGPKPEAAAEVKAPGASASAASAVVSNAAKASLNILLVEDLVNNQKLALGVLERVGHKVTVANDGREGLALFAKGGFDLILTDLQMPNMSGYEMTHSIRTGEGLPAPDPKIPIIAVTAHALEAERARCMEAGMDGFLRKPYRAQELLSALAPYVERKPAPAAPHRVVPSRVLPARERPVLGQPEEEGEELAKSRSLFLAEGTNKLQGVRRHLDRQDPLQARRAAEWLKKTAAQVGANRVKVQAMRLMGKAEMKNWEESDRIFATLDAEVRQAIQALDPTQAPAAPAAAGPSENAPAKSVQPGAAPPAAPPPPVQTVAQRPTAAVRAASAQPAAERSAAAAPPASAQPAAARPTPAASPAAAAPAVAKEGVAGSGAPANASDGGGLGASADRPQPMGSKGEAAEKPVAQKPVQASAPSAEGKPPQ